ncbi:MAG: lysophospholipase L1-like esterase, partial [Myxococcota bacterium]
VRVRAGGKGKTTLFGVALERKQAGVVLDALGLLGMRARRWGKADAEHMKTQVAMRKPDLVVVNFGGNERVDNDLSVGKHKKEIAGLLTLMRAGAPDAACLVVGPGAHGVKKGGKRIVDPALATIYEAQRAAAKDAGCGFLDTVALTGGDDSIERLRKDKLIGADMAHLNHKGHHHVGNLMADWLLGQYDAWASAK